jgi:SAM-dependent methyltransferase
LSSAQSVRSRAERRPAPTGRAPICFCGSTAHNRVRSGSSDRLLLQSFPFEVVQCAECGLARTLPVPDAEQYVDGYALTTENGRFTGESEDAWSARILDDVEAHCAGRRLLDVGCHVGNLVAAARERGFDAEGIDLDPISTAEGRRLGRNVRAARIDDVNGSFDVVVMSHVLEHVDDLRGFLSGVGDVIAPGGHAYILVPHYRGLMPRLMGNRWIGWFPSQHVWHFTPETLVQVVEEASALRVARLATRGVIEPPSKGAKGQVKRLVTLSSKACGWGDEIEAFFVKPGAMEAS